MLKLIIEDDEGRKTVVPFVRDEITIGRQEGNTIRLTERNVSRRHARLQRVNGHVVVEDLGSYNGIRVNGERIAGKSTIHSGDLVQIGDYDLAIESADVTQAAAPAPTAPASPPPSLVQTRVDEAAVTGEEVDEGPAEVSADQIEDADSTGNDTLPEVGFSKVPTSVIRGGIVDSSDGAPTTGLIQELNAAVAPRLVLLNTDWAGREFACIRTELTIGRGDESDIPIDHRSLSRNHAKLVRDAENTWRIHDLQSANGLTVNGDVYAQAVLSPGDEVELGHVRLKFLAAGQAFRFVPTGKKKKKGLRPVRTLLVLGLLGLVAFAGYREFRTPGFLRGLVADGQARIAALSPKPSTEPVPEVAATPAAPDSERDTVAEVGESAAVLDSAADAIAARNMERAIVLLEPFLAKEGLSASRRREATELLENARAEIQARKSLSLAKQALGSGKLDEAKKLIASAETTHAYARELAEVRTELNAAQPAAPAAKPAPTTPVNTAAATAPTAAPAPASNPAQADKLFRQGTDQFVKKQYQAAVSTYSRCLEADSNFARCHMMLGSAYARLGQVEKGATHYRTFVKMAPTDSEASKVKALLDDYERTRKNKAPGAPGTSP